MRGDIMGLIERIFGNRHQAEPNYNAYKTFTAYQPRFTSWDGRLYESELVRAAVDAKARHISKLSYSVHGAAKPKMAAATKIAPNPFMTWAQFLERCYNIYDVQNNLFIVPLLNDTGDVNGFWPVVPSQCEIVEKNGQPYLRFNFRNGERRSMELIRCAIIPKHQLMDDFFGETNSGALTSTMELINMVSQGIVEGVKNSASYRFMAQYNNHLFDEDIAKERKRFDRNNFEGGGGGLLLFDNRFTNIQQLKPSQYTVDPAQMTLIRDNVYSYFGVNDAILKNTASPQELDALYNGCIEPFAIKLSEALTRIVFTPREQSVGNRIIFTANRLQYMSVAEKVSIIKEMWDRGGMTIDEGRELLNYEKLPDGLGDHIPARGEYYMIDEEPKESQDGDTNDQ